MLSARSARSQTLTSSRNFRHVSELPPCDGTCEYENCDCVSAISYTVTAAGRGTAAAGACSGPGRLQRAAVQGVRSNGATPQNGQRTLRYHCGSCDVVVNMAAAATSSCSGSSSNGGESDHRTIMRAGAARAWPCLSRRKACLVKDPARECA